MAFLQLKKNPHKDKPINIKLLGDWTNVVAKPNPFGDMSIVKLFSILGYFSVYFIYL